MNFAAAKGIRSFRATVAQENLASRRVAEKAGMTVHHTAQFKKRGTDTVYPSVIYQVEI